MTKEQLYKRFARYYDLIYANLNHEKESDFIKWSVDKHKTSQGNKLLDVACGTGRHVKLLNNNFNVVGVDINPAMLKIAREKVPNVDFLIGDMKKLNLNYSFDILICLFSAINYNTTLEELEITLINFNNHLQPGGVLIFDLGLNIENWIEGLVSVDTVVDKNLKLVRICQSHLEDGIFNSSFVFFIKENGKLDFDIDQHELGVFGIEDVVKLLEKLGFSYHIYADFTSASWEITSGERPVFVGVKKN